MELIDTVLIERIRKALMKRYDRDQQIQQMIEEIGADEGLNESELAIVYQAYLEVKDIIHLLSLICGIKLKRFKTGCPCCIPTNLLSKICLAMC